MAQALFSADILGVKEIEDAFRKLGKTHTRSTLQRVLKKAGQPVKSAMSITAPRDGTSDPDSPGHMADNIVVGRLSKSQQRRRKAAGRGKRFAEIFIGPAAKFGQAHLVEFGTGPRVSKTTGKNVKVTRMSHYVRFTLEDLEEFKERMKNGGKHDQENRSGNVRRRLEGAERSAKDEAVQEA